MLLRRQPNHSLARSSAKPKRGKRGVYSCKRERNKDLNENKQGWSTLVTAPKSRIGEKHRMIARLGPVHWASFLEHANMHHKAAFLALFTESDRLVCSGPLEGGHCPRDFGLSMTELGLDQPPL